MSNTESNRNQRLSDADVLRAVPPTPGARQFRVGVFVILGIAAFFTVLFLMTSPGTFRGRYMVTTHVEDAQGIRRGDPVRMRGINIGRVHAFELAPAGGVVITLEVEGDWPIPVGSRTELLSLGFLGGMVVSVIPGDGDDFVEPWTLIPGAGGAGVLETVGDLAGEAEDVLTRIQDVLSDSTIAGTGEVVVQLRDLLGEFGEIIDGQATEVRSLTASLRRAAENVEEISGADEWRRALASAEATLETVERTSGAIDTGVASLNVVLGRIERGEGTLGRLSVDDSLYESLDEAASSLQALLADIKENPDRYVTIEIF
ncbi:MAG: MlaD family protein [Gemmatimonadota bacterium]|nr:MlaD family protein [Gemmatimonadota bacterium]